MIYNWTGGDQWTPSCGYKAFAKNITFTMPRQLQAKAKCNFYKLL